MSTAPSPSPPPPPELAAKRARDSAPGRTAVIVVHGLWMPGTEMVLLRRRLSAAGLTPVLFRYKSVTRNLTDNAAALAEFADGVPADTLHFVGHSLGGVLPLDMFARHAPDRPGRIVCLGSPLCGTTVGSRLSGFGSGGRRVIGKSIEELVTRGGLPHWSSPREVGVIAGSLPIGLGRPFGLRGANDGMVTVAETMLPGAVDHLVLKLSHTALLMSARSAREVVHFLEHGRFRHEP
jgi:pimeloyl-ACP methyl ester carboxylesterase